MHNVGVRTVCNTRNLGGGGLPIFQSQSKNLRSRKLLSGLLICRTARRILGQSMEHCEKTRFSSRNFNVCLTSLITVGDSVADATSMGHSLCWMYQRRLICRYSERNDPHSDGDWTHAAQGGVTTDIETPKYTGPAPTTLVAATCHWLHFVSGTLSKSRLGWTRPR